MLNRNNPKPLYAQLEDVIRLSITRGEYKSNKAIPSENELSKIYGLSRMTVRTVLKKLVDEGLLYRVQGKGTFIAEQKISTKSPAYLGIREQLEEQGYSIETKLITFNHVKADLVIAKKLNIFPGDKVIFIKRLRYLDQMPISLHESYIPLTLCSTLTQDNMETAQLCTIIADKFNLKPEKVTETLESILANTDESRLLGVSLNSPLLKLDDINTASNGLTFEYTKILFRGDKIRLHFEYEKNK